MFSECIVMMVMYHIICFTPFVPEVEVRFKLGYLVCAIISSHLVVSLAILLKTNARIIRMKRRMYKANKENSKFRSDLKEKWEERRAKREQKRKDRKERLKKEYEERLKQSMLKGVEKVDLELGEKEEFDNDEAARYILGLPGPPLTSQ